MTAPDPARLMRFVLELRQAGVTDGQALRALEKTSRALYAPDHLQPLAFEDRDLPLPHGQTMTRPSIIGRVLTALALAPEMSVLEIGAGSGYQAGCIAALARKVTTLDRITDLVTTARTKFGAARLMHVSAHLADGHEGWPQSAPYDRIVVNGAIEALPDALRAQLAPQGVAVFVRGGRLIRVDASGETDCGACDLASLKAGVES